MVGIRSKAEPRLEYRPEPPPLERVMAPGQARITIVDDDSELRRLLADALCATHRVTHMAAPASMMPIAESAPDLLILRLESSTPTALTGLEVASLARRHRLLARVPIIILTADARHLHDRALLTALTDVHVVPMPFDLATIQAVVHSVVRQSRATMPAYAERATPPPARDFERDPHGWFDWVGEEVSEPSWRTVRASIQPARWTGTRGRQWRIVRTASGIEIRPDLVSPFIHYNDAAKVTAIALGDDVEVELTSRSGRWVDRFSRDALDVGALGRSMMDERELPHDNLPRLFPRGQRSTIA